MKARRHFVIKCFIKFLVINNFIKKFHSLENVILNSKRSKNISDIVKDGFLMHFIGILYYYIDMI